MTRVAGLHRRVRALGKRTWDRSGLIPDSPQWNEYWAREVQRIVDSDDRSEMKQVPIEGFYAWMMSFPDGH